MSWGSRNIVKMVCGKITNGKMTEEEGRLYHYVTIQMGKVSFLAGIDNIEIKQLEYYLPAEARYLDHIEKHGETEYTKLIKGTMVTARDVSGLKLEDRLG